MAVPKAKKSKAQKRQRKAANRYKGIETAVCPVCQAPVLTHRACSSCGNYKNKQVITVEE
jgi:large subunit ribosomal protein L32